MSVLIFGIVAVLWVAFAVTLLVWGSSLHEIWLWLRSQGALVQIPLWIVFLPWALAMLVWETSWPTAVRGLLVVGIAWANLYAFLPWKPVR